MRPDYDRSELLAHEQVVANGSVDRLHFDDFGECGRPGIQRGSTRRRRRSRDRPRDLVSTVGRF